MASSLLPPHLTFTPTRPKPGPNLKPTHSQIYCGSGPRSNRGPLLKGRILSTEAILAIQSLKRSHRNNKNTSSSVHVSPLTRLLKSDLIAALQELLRQDEVALALHVFSAIRSEAWYTAVDFSLYADVTLALSRNSMGSHIDHLVGTIDTCLHIGAPSFVDKKGLGRLVRALIGAHRREALVHFYKVIRRAGWGVVGSSVEVDEYLGRVLVKGFVRFGEVELAKEVESVLEAYLNSCLGR
ncbi:hypothetical protein vseg_020785 [Gypsophila vaccaria]